MKDQVKKMRWVVFLLLVASLVLAGAALAMAEGDLGAADEGTTTTVSTDSGTTSEGETPPDSTPAEDPATVDPSADPAPDPTADAPVVDEPVADVADPSAEPEATLPAPLLGDDFEIVFGLDTITVNHTGDGEGFPSTTVDLFRTNNHGAYVSALAKARPKGMKTSAWVRLLAQSDVGKKSYDEPAGDEETGDEQAPDQTGTDPDEPAATDEGTSPTDEVTPPADDGQTVAATVAPQTGASSSKSLHATKSLRSTKSVHATKSVKVHSRNSVARSHGKGHNK